MACKQISYLETPTHKVGLKNPYLICDYYGGSHEAEECRQNNPVEQVCLSRGDIYNDPSLLKFYQNDDIPPWGNNKRKEKGEDGPEWVHRKGMHEQFSQILSTIGKSKIPELEAPTFAITTRYGINTRDPPFPAQSTPSTTLNGRLKKEGPEGVESSSMDE
ncbi:hypothetical protein Tco_0369686 [Tanacetum coccineum]